MKATKYVYYKIIGDCCIIVHLITFQFIVLKQQDSILFFNHDYEKMSCYQELIEKFFVAKQIEIIEKDLLLRANRVLASKGQRNPSHVIFMTDSCNQKCTYCFEKLSESLFKHNTVLSYDQIDHIIHAICVQNKYTKRESKITIFGGEPLLEKCFDSVAYFIRIFKESKLGKFSIVTNGITLPFYFDLLRQNEDIISRIIITLNGFDDMHDQVRGNQVPTFECIIENIEKFLIETQSIGIQINLLLNKRNISSMEMLLPYLDSKGLLHNKRTFLPFGRIQFRTNPEKHGYQDELLYEEYYAELLTHFMHNTLVDDKMITGSEVSILSTIYRFWKGKEFAFPHFRGCEAVYPGRFCYYVDDKIYPCTEVAGQADFVIGDYMKDDFEIDVQKKWLDFSPFKIEKCASCKYIAFCGGACPVTNKCMNGSIDAVYCLRIEQSLSRMIDVLYKEGFFHEQLSV